MLKKFQNTYSWGPSPPLFLLVGGGWGGGGGGGAAGQGRFFWSKYPVVLLNFI